MSYVKQNFVDGQTLTAAQLNHMEAGIANAAGTQGEKGDKGEKGDPGPAGAKGDPGEGFTANAKALLLNLFENAAYKTDTMQPTLNALRAEWGGSAQEVPVQSVSRDHDPEREREQDPDGHRAARERNRQGGGVERSAYRICHCDKRRGNRHQSR